MLGRNLEALDKRERIEALIEEADVDNLYMGDFSEVNLSSIKLFKGEFPPSDIYEIDEKAYKFNLEIDSIKKSEHENCYCIYLDDMDKKLKWQIKKNKKTR